MTDGHPAPTHTVLQTAVENVEGTVRMHTGSKGPGTRDIHKG